MRSESHIRRSDIHLSFRSIIENDFFHKFISAELFEREMSYNVATLLELPPNPTTFNANSTSFPFSAAPPVNQEAAITPSIQ